MSNRYSKLVGTILLQLDGAAVIMKVADYDALIDLELLLSSNSGSVVESLSMISKFSEAVCPQHEVMLTEPEMVLYALY